jgi:hypothetical protein
MARPPYLALGACLCLFVLSACGGEGSASDGTPSPAPARPTPTAPPHDAASEPRLEAPASRYAVLQDDLGRGFITDVGATITHNATSYSVSKVFADPEDGVEKLNSWGYTDGYENSYMPDGRERAVLNGAFYFAVESHLFESEEGAREAMEHIEARLEASVSRRVDVYPVGNASSGWEAMGDYIPGSSVPSVHHRVVFRRGNLLTMVATWGAEPFVTVNSAHEIARIVDEKALGERAAPVPTPAGNVAPANGTDPGSEEPEAGD